MSPSRSDVTVARMRPAGTDHVIADARSSAELPGVGPPDAAIAAQAASAAAAAEAKAGVDIVVIGSAADSHAAATLLSEVWGADPDQPIVPAELIRSLAHVDSYGALALAGGAPVGAALEFFGRAALGLFLHSYIAGVKAGQRGSSVGFALKQHQRGWALARGLSRVASTFDPLVSRNAFFNLAKLGATAVAYHADFYGSMRDGLNAGDLSDRIVIDWVLDSDRAIAASELQPHLVDPRVLDSAAAVRLRVGPNGEPEAGPGRGDVALVQIPEDIVALRRADIGLARRWRMAMRETLGGALAAGASIEGVTRDGWYVLRSR